MAQPAVLTMISGVSSPTVSNTFVNNNAEICALQISGTFSSATVKVEGIVDINSGKWVNLATFDVSDLDLKTNGMTDKSIYRVGIVGIRRIRVSVTAVSGGNITVMANFVGTSYFGDELPPSSEVPFTAYDEAVLGGYDGTKAAFDEGLANVLNVVPYAEQAAASATSAQTSAENAASAASNAWTYAGNASTSAFDAQSSANNAAASAGSASSFASSASSSAIIAQSSAAVAQTASANAGSSAAAAQTAANNASSYASNAATSATNAAASATNAATSATNAATSATSAATSATQAANAVGSIAPALVTDWLNANVNPVGSAVVVDSSLSVPGAAADAKVTGDKITVLNKAVDEIEEVIDIPYTPDFNVIEGGIAKSGSSAGSNTSSTIQARTQYIDIVPGTTYYIHLNTTNFYIWSPWTYSSAEQASVLRGLYDLLRDGQNIIFTAQANEKKFRMSCLKQDDTTMTSEDRTALKNAIELYTFYDNTLTVSNAIPDSKTVGDKINNVSDSVYDLYRYSMADDAFQPSFQENQFIAFSTGELSSNSSYPYYYGSKNWNYVSSESPLKIRLDDADAKVRIFRYSSASSSSFVSATTYSGGQNIILNGSLNGSENQYRYVRFDIYKKDNSYSTAIFNGLVAAFSIYKLTPESLRGYPKYRYFKVSVNQNMPWNPEDADNETNMLDCDCVLLLPDNYNVKGRPHQLVFAHHGASGTVDADTESWYTSTWRSFMNDYLSANGFAVFDINGYGPANPPEGDTTEYGRDYGCPRAMQAFIKAYNYIRARYNVSDQVIVCGYSMGGVTAMAVAQTFPGITKAIGLLSPARLERSALSYANVLQAYGYNDRTVAEADDYKKCRSSAVMLDYFDADGARVFPAFSYNWAANANNYTILTRNVTAPLKAWCALDDDSVDPETGSAIVSAMRSAGKEAYFRSFATGGHAIGGGGNATVDAEFAAWLKRFQ